MTTRAAHMESGIIEKNLAYYDGIAGAYDAILEQDHLNQRVRTKVAGLFCRLILPGTILDFGGGTGKDLPWLLQNGYKVIFCEPSAGMREKAITGISDLAGNDHVFFLDHHAADFRNWKTNLPFPDEVAGALANFAVLNSIPELPLLFENLSLVIRPGGYLLLLVLNAGLLKRWKTNRKATLMNLFNGDPVTGTVHFREQQQTIYLHMINRLKKDAAPWFRFAGHIPIKENGFELIYLTRK